MRRRSWMHPMGPMDHGGLAGVIVGPGACTSRMCTCSALTPYFVSPRYNPSPCYPPPSQRILTRVPMYPANGPSVTVHLSCSLGCPQKTDAPKLCPPIEIGPVWGRRLASASSAPEKPGSWYLARPPTCCTFCSKLRCDLLSPGRLPRTRDLVLPSESVLSSSLPLPFWRVTMVGRN